MPKLNITPEAKDDLHDIKEYITTELENPIAAVNTVTRITKAMRRLRDFPGSGTPLFGVVEIPNVYRFLVCGSYLVIYRHEGNNVFVVRILYGKRDYAKILFRDVPESEPESAE